MKKIILATMLIGINIVFGWTGTEVLGESSYKDAYKTPFKIKVFPFKNEAL
ncbi:hypothetical protein [Helicobacter rodentium]|uniref:hypothetical protein n=1 Tax=Helicobacter rodentium TaxID=59617 RepID=UPI0023F1F931|nr:hypothetical protein [Helicobacter rodentium]